MSNSLLVMVVHPRKFDRNQFRVLFDWFDFIHRCFFHSRWSCPLNQAVIPSLDLHIHSIPFHFIQWSLDIQCLLCLFQTPYHHSLVVHWFRIQSSIDSFPAFHHNPDWFSLHVPILCVIDVKNENMEFMRNRRSKLNQSSLMQCSELNRNVLYLIIL